jgi:hypothetical protein
MPLPQAVVDVTEVVVVEVVVGSGVAVVDVVPFIVLVVLTLTVVDVVDDVNVVVLVVVVVVVGGATWREKFPWLLPNPSTTMK